MRPHVAGAQPVHGHLQRAGGFLEEPVSPITGTKFENAKTTKMVHITEFTADLIKNNKLKLDKSRNDNLKVTFHDSCNPARGMGFWKSRATCHQEHVQPLL
jgi:Fe-S oxidoreductase